MPPLSQFRARLQALFRKRRMDAEMVEEMNAHLEARARQRMAEGLPREAAWMAARRAFGPVAQVQEQCREQRGWPRLERCGRDFARASRSLRHSPGFTAVALLSLALGMGANTAVFSLVKSVLLNPLPYPHGERLVSLWVKQNGVDAASFSFPEFTDYATLNRSFEAVAGYRMVTYVLTGEGEPEQLSASQVSASMFSVLGLAPELGRAFTAAEDVPGAPPLALLSDSLWRRRFGADRRVLGRVLQLDNTPFTVIGVLPAEYAAFANVDLVAQVGRASGNGGWNLRTMRPGLFGLGRLKAGVTLPQALADLSHLGSLLAQQYPGANGGSAASGQLLFDKMVGEYRRGLWLLLGAVAMVLLIACANLANLLLARGVGREAEIAVRAALGASRGRIVSEILAESVLLALAGGALGLMLTFAARRGIVLLSPTGVERFQHAAIDGTVLAVAFGASLLTALLFGGWPAWRASQTDLRMAIEGGGRTTSGRGVTRAREGLIVAEVGLTFVLLVGAGLLFKSFAREQAVNLGFETKGVVTARLKVPWVVYNSPEKVLSFNQRLLDSLTSIRGVEAAAFATSVPLVSVGRTGEYYTEGMPEQVASQLPTAELDIVSEDYFGALGMPVLRGRGFDARDSLTSPLTAVIDRDFAERNWGGANALGKTIRLRVDSFFAVALINGHDHTPSFTIVGIVPPVHLYGYATEPRLPQIYLSARQLPANTYRLVVRAARGAGALVESMRQAVRKVDVNQPISEAGAMDDYLDTTFAASRLYTYLVSIFAGLALLLASVGLYGVLAYQVTRRRREFGIRLALGGRTSQITALVLGRGLRLVGVGFAAGLFGALVLGRLLSSLLFRTSAFDSEVFAMVSGVLFLVSMLAAWLPSRRAARIPPAETLRAQ